MLPFLPHKLRNAQKSFSVVGHGLHVPFDLDVWRYLCRGKGQTSGRWLLFQKEDFERFPSLPHHWYHFLNIHGEGKAIDFPLKLRPYLAKSCNKDFLAEDNGNVVKAQIFYSEKLSIYFVKRHVM
jgi:hypothetical protein